MSWLCNRCYSLTDKVKNCVEEESMLLNYPITIVKSCVDPVCSYISQEVRVRLYGRLRFGVKSCFWLRCKLWRRFPAEVYSAAIFLHWHIVTCLNTFLATEVSFSWFSEVNLPPVELQLKMYNQKKHFFYLFLDSSTSEDNKGSGRSSNNSAGSTDSSICKRAWWAGDHRWWLTGPSASLEQVTVKHNYWQHYWYSSIFYILLPQITRLEATEGTYGTRWAWLHDPSPLLCHREHQWCKNTHRYPTTSPQWWPDQQLLSENITLVWNVKEIEIRLDCTAAL